MTKHLPVILSAVAAVLAAAALVIALTHKGPAGPRGATGAPGRAASNTVTAQVTAIRNCLPELTAWINGFNVQSNTYTDSGSNLTWLTNAYLDTSGRQVASDCRALLFGKNG